MSKHRRLVLRVEYDDQPTCPMEYDGAWTLVSFNNRSIHYRDPSEYLEDWDGSEASPNEDLREKFEQGLAFWLEYYEHGPGAYSLKGQGFQCRWDTTRLAGILLWEHDPDDMGAKTPQKRAEDANSFLEAYNNWMNGWVYGHILETVDGEDIHSCWGYDDTDYMISEVNGHLEPGDLVEVTGQAKDLISLHSLKEGVILVPDHSEREFAVIHTPSGEQVKGEFSSELEAYRWLKAACDQGEVQPADINDYAVEECDLTEE
jgi:hypothetical protein